MTPKSVGFKLGIVVASLHLILALLAYAAASSSMDAQAGLVFIPFFFLDAPLLFLGALLPGGEWIMGQPLIIYGLLGSLLWFALPWLVDRLAVRIFPKLRRLARWMIVLASLPVFFFAFIPLSAQAIAMSIRNDRPEELQALLKNPVTGTLAKRTVLEEEALGGVCGIHPTSDGGEILVACHRGVLRLDRQYAVTSRLPFPENNYYQSVQPVRIGGAFSGQYLVHELFEHAALLGPDGRELWRAGGKGEPGQMVEGVRAGDIDGDGRPEFAVYYGYGVGILLVDETGQTRWKHPVDSLDHLEMADVRGNGRQEILFRDSPSTFKVLVDQGQVAAELNIATDSSTFALVAWPVPTGRPHLVLAEENQIRIVDLEGNEIRRLDAPGCRSFGDLAAVPVRFRADTPAYLAVRKMLHPDLSALYVYDAEGQLVHHDVEVILGSGDAALAAVPVGESGAERLLVGSKNDTTAQLIEYSLD